MAVEDLAIIEAPSGLAANGAGGALTDAANWLCEHGVQPSWVVAGGVLGLLLTGISITGAAKGALLGGVVSWLVYEFGSE